MEVEIQNNFLMDLIKIGDYVVIQKQNYLKLHKMNSKATVMLGKDSIELSSTIGNPLPSTYKMESKGKNCYQLIKCHSTISMSEELLKDASSGIDNRNIYDDGNSQQLSKDEIVELKDKGLSGSSIVEQLLENSKTFSKKTEYAQEKYLKKKEKKYCEYLTISRPNIRLVADILYKQDPSKILGIRLDTLSQMLTAIDIQSSGHFLVYESGCQGLIAASMLNAIHFNGLIINLHPGISFQKNALLAMNFNEQQMNNLLTVNINGLLKRLSPSDNTTKDIKNLTNQDSLSLGFSLQNNKNNNTDLVLKRKHSESDNEKDEDAMTRKKPRWQLEAERAVTIMQSTKMDALLVVSKEKPNNIVHALLPFVSLSRPLCVYCPCREPLIELYFELKSLGNVIALHLTESWLRTHQVLSGRTHPAILMSGSGGYLLTGIVVEPKNIT